jgi:hypothetical protein
VYLVEYLLVTPLTISFCSINATVMGSKQTKEDGKENGDTAEEDQAEDAPEEKDAE